MKENNNETLKEINRNDLENKLKELNKSQFMARQMIIGKQNELEEMKINLNRIDGAIEITKEYLKPEEKKQEENNESRIVKS